MPNHALPDLICACATIRRAARLVTLLYSEEMDHGVEPPQFALMTALTASPGATQAALGRALGLDKTTMSRNLRVMERNGWIEPAPSKDQRERGYRLTAAGRKALRASMPGWERAQNKLRAALDPGEWDTMLRVMNRVGAASMEAAER